MLRNIKASYGFHIQHTRRFPYAGEQTHCIQLSVAMQVKWNAVSANILDIWSVEK